MSWVEPVLAGDESSSVDCVVAYELHGVYPLLSTSRVSRVSGEAGVQVYLQRGRGIVELEGCLYEVDRELEVTFDTFTEVTMLFEFPEYEAGSKLFVTSERGEIESWELSAPVFAVALDPDQGLGFEYVPPEQAAPTKPVIVSKPSGGNPTPP